MKISLNSEENAKELLKLDSGNSPEGSEPPPPPPEPKDPPPGKPTGG